MAYQQNFFKNYRSSSRAQTHVDREVNNLLKATLPEADPMPEKPTIIQILKTYPMFAGMLDALGSSAISVRTLAYLNKTAGVTAKSVKDLGTATGVLSIGLSLINFVRLPLIFLAYRALGQPKPFTLTKLAKWLYSGLMFGLAVASFFVPVIGLVSAGIGLGASFFTLGRLLYERHQLRNDLHRATERISELEIELEDAKEQLKEAKDQFNENRDEASFQKMHGVIEKIQSIQEEGKSLKNKSAKLSKVLDKKGTMSIVNSSVEIALGTAAVVGAAILLTNPIVGMTILAATSIIGLTYAVGVAFVLPKLRTLFEKAEVDEQKQDAREQKREGGIADASSHSRSMKTIIDMSAEYSGDAKEEVSIEQTAKQENVASRHAEATVAQVVGPSAVSDSPKGSALIEEVDSDALKGPSAM